MNEATEELVERGVLRVLTLDGEGAKGFYTLGVLKEIEAMGECSLYKKSDMVFGTSTGAIMASVIALGHGVASIMKLYRKNVPFVMSEKTARARTLALEKLTSEIYADATFSDVNAGIGIVTAKWMTERANGRFCWRRTFCAGQLNQILGESD